ncbi:hypothetical protein [Sporosarcina sp. 6E9]|uniref:hypothetical protein n=1 Tax=Sporosarcina sp. 6E9 TaxID=2819235 RepID=UPI001B3144FD|nr:hypothetical protein [Sporosarcina sp. 6E9]
MPEFIIALLIYIILELVNSQVYNNVMSLSVVFSFLVFFVILSKHRKTNKKPISVKRKITGHTILFSIVLVCIYFSLPALTFNQAKEIVLNNYDITIKESYNVPLESEWNPFAAKWAYWFEGYNSKQEKISLMVSPDTGKVFLMD